MSLDHFVIPLSILCPVGKNVRKSFKVCTFSCPLKGPDNNKIMCIKYGSCKDLLEHLQRFEDFDVVPVEGIPEDEVFFEGVPMTSN